MKSKIVVLALSIAALLLPAAGAAAQSTSAESTQVTNNSNSIRISPVRTDIALDPGSTKEITVYVQNMGTTPVQAKSIISDFAPSFDESGKPSVILEEDEYAPTHSLKRLATTSPSLVTLTPGVRVPVKAIVTVPKNAQAGGYYGAVRFVPADNLTTGNDTGVAISTNVGSLILLKVNGDVQEKLTLQTFEVRQNEKAGTFFKKPNDLKIVLRLKNEGNIQTPPFGKIQISKSGKTVEEYEVNNVDPRGNVLPESIRRFEVKLQKIGSFGKYTVEGNFGYGAGGELITAKTTFWVVPTTYFIVGGIALVALIVLIVLIPKMLGAYKRRILSGRGRRY